MNSFANEVSRPQSDMRTWFLVARPSFIIGFGSLAALWGGQHRYNVAATGNEADARALYSDWRMVGQDLRDSISLCAPESH
jgi:hypothetical protein